MTVFAGIPAALRDRLVAVRSIGAVTGAGLSAESGIPTYRGAGGLYDDPEEGDRTVEALSGPTLNRDPDRTWRAIAALARHAREARPNAAHRALAEADDRVERCVVLTQNVDGLHDMAGSRHVIEIHGALRRIRCTACPRREDWEVSRLAEVEAAPRCPRCGEVLRPDVVLFEEMLPEAPLAAIGDEFMANTPDLVLIAGTTALFPYISAPVHVARQRGRLTVEINPEPTEVSGIVDFALRGPAGTVLPALIDAIGTR